MPVNSAQPELLTLAAAMRGEEWADDLAGALIAAHHAGWDWPKTFIAATRLMADEDALPKDLTEATRDPLKRPGGPPRDESAIAAIQAEMEARAEQARIDGRERARLAARRQDGAA